MISFLTSKLGKLLGALVAAATILLGVFKFGRKAQRKDTQVEKLEKYVETKKEIDDVKVSSDPTNAISRLRDNRWLR